MEYNKITHITTIVNALIKCKKNGILGDYYEGYYESLGICETYRYGTGIYLALIDQKFLNKLLEEQNLLHLTQDIDESYLQSLSHSLYRCPIEVSYARSLMNKYLKRYRKFPEDFDNLNCELLTKTIEND